MTQSVLDSFHPLIRQWFQNEVGSPTDIQSQAWPLIAQGEHVLVTAPTGSGKTLTAFLWAIHRFVSQEWPTGAARVLYVSPLKALNNDVQRNLIQPLAELKAYFKRANAPFPDIRVLTRSGDTPPNERRRMLRRPPEILITTPESLNILISSKSGRRMLTGITTVILDEIHAVAGNKRGTHLITAVERLTLLCGEFQRIALSATVKPLEQTAQMIGGYTFDGRGADGVYKPRCVQTVVSKSDKTDFLSVNSPSNAGEYASAPSVWPALINAFKAIIRKNRATLFFANSRRLTEKVTRLINADEPEEIAYSHHGSLAKEIRLAVEQKLKKGELKAIVATNTLELGIDIGALDQVVLIQTPRSIASGLQRIGRAGHAVGAVSRGRLFPTHGRDFIDAAVMARSIQDQAIESLHPIENPLDVLAQIIIAMTAVEQWDIDALYAFLKTAYPLRTLSRKQFDLVLEMLAGRYADTRIRELKPRVSLDRLDNTVQAREGALMLVYMAGGTIPDRGYFDLRIQETGAKIGELDEEFVWERRIGETFALGAQAWRIRRITSNDVEVLPASAGAGIIPFWRAEARNRDFHYSQKIAAFLEQANEVLGHPQSENAFLEQLHDQYFMDACAADELMTFLKRQVEISAADLPHRHHLLIEHFDDPLNRADSKQVILHTLWGGRINRPCAITLAAAWEERHNYPLEIFADDDCILLMLPHALDADTLLNLLRAEDVEPLLREGLEKTGFFGARFRENAGRALLLPKVNFKKRMPLWLNRLRAQKLLKAVKPLADFPILSETWRTCIKDEFDLVHLKQLLDEIAEGQIRVTETVTRTASPFADHLIWRQTNQYMYADDTPTDAAKSGLSDDLFREIVMSSAALPRIPEPLIRLLEQKLHCTAEGYAPRTSVQLLDWVKERLLIPWDEWRELLEAIYADHGVEAEALLEPLTSKLFRIRPPGATTFSVCAAEMLPHISQCLTITGDESDLTINQLTPGLNPAAAIPFRHALSAFTTPDSRAETDETQPDGSAFILQWLTYYGPVPQNFIRQVMGLESGRLDRILKHLSDKQALLVGQWRETHDHYEICERNNLEILLRMLRKARRPAFQALDCDQLPLFLAGCQGVAARGDGMDDLQERLEALFAFPAPAAAWEESILPARMEPYYTAWLDSLMQSGALAWFGCGHQRISFAFADDLSLFATGLEPDKSTASEPQDDVEIERLFPHPHGRYGFFDVIRHCGLDSAALTRQLWELVWKQRITNDTFAIVRQGVQNHFKPVETPTRRTRRNPRFSRWKASRPLPGSWYVLPKAEENGVITAAEMNKERARQLLQRHGVLFRELCAHELPEMQWSQLFRALRTMELSGELLAGHFIKDIPGVQFCSHEAFRFLNRPLPQDAIYWMNATDPASLCGLKLPAFKGVLPPRRVSCWLVFHGPRNVLIAYQNGKHLTIQAPPDSAHIPDYLAFFKVLLTRQFNPLSRIQVQTINDAPATQSPYALMLKTFGFIRDYRYLTLW